MSAVFAPAPGAAPLPRMVLAQARMEARLMLRNGEQQLLPVAQHELGLHGGLGGHHPREGCGSGSWGQVEGAHEASSRPVSSRPVSSRNTSSSVR